MPNSPPPREASVDPVDVEARAFGCVLTHRGQDAAWIRLDGELDVATTPELARTLSQAMESARLILIDVRGLTFGDRTGIELLIEADTKTRRSGHRLVFVRDSTESDHGIGLVGTSSRLKVIDLADFKSFTRAPTPLAAPQPIR